MYISAKFEINCLAVKNKIDELTQVLANYYSDAAQSSLGKSFKLLQKYCYKIKISVCYLQYYGHHTITHTH